MNQCRCSGFTVGGYLPAINIVGLPDTAVQEARERVRSANHLEDVRRLKEVIQ